MARPVTYSHARQNLARLLDEAEQGQEPIIISRRHHEDVALIPLAELRGLQETAHLLRSPKNARRLLAALRRALAGSVAPRSVRRLKRDLGLE